VNKSQVYHTAKCYHPLSDKRR